MNNANVFNGKAKYYDKRPQYPVEILNIIQESVSLSRNDIIADIGCGPGSLSKHFVEKGYKVYGVEPNCEMLQSAKERFKHNKNFVPIKGFAESTTLSSCSMDLIIVGQAFQWFDCQKTKKEFNRILRKNKNVVLVWNIFKDDTSFISEYNKLINNHLISNSQLNQKINLSQINQFFPSNQLKYYSITTSTEQSIERFIEGFCSCSFYDGQEHNMNKQILDMIKELCIRESKEGILSYDYETLLFIGSIY